MTDKKEDLIKSILDKASQDNDYYINYIAQLFSQLSGFNYNQNNYQQNEDEFLIYIKKNIKKLVEHLYSLKEDKNKDLYQCLSCIYGAFLGDAIGGYCEFKSASPDNINFVFKGNPIFGESPGQVTDDSEMAMACAYGIMDNPDMLRLNSDYLYYFYGCWYLSVYI